MARRKIQQKSLQALPTGKTVSSKSDVTQRNIEAFEIFQKIAENKIDFLKREEKQRIITVSNTSDSNVFLVV